MRKAENIEAALRALLTQIYRHIWPGDGCGYEGSAESEIKALAQAITADSTEWTHEKPQASGTFWVRHVNDDGTFSVPIIVYYDAEIGGALAFRADGNREVGPCASMQFFPLLPPNHITAGA